MALDRYRRPIRDLRLSVTDRCDLRCTYCMPNEHYEWLQRDRILGFEEITRLARQFVALGVQKIRLTGGEPLLRRQVEELVEQLASIEGLQDLCLTTNGTRLTKLAGRLKDAGLRRINVSLDTLDRAKFQRITRRDRLAEVLEGIEAARTVGFAPIKINMVVEAGVNDDEIEAMTAYCRDRDLSLRFIEFMDVGNANGWNLDRVVPERRILDRVRAAFPLDPIDREDPSDTATPYRFRDGQGTLGVIASVTRPFCTGCSRARLTAEGSLVTCLFSTTGTDLKSPLRAGAPDEEIRRLVRRVWIDRADRFSEERLASLRSGAYDPAERQKIEMIRLGG